MEPPQEQYFKGTIGQARLKEQLYIHYAGAKARGIPAKPGMLLSEPGMGKSEQFVPGIARMLDAEVVGPFGISLNMHLDDLMIQVAIGVEDAKARGVVPLIVLEELANIGAPNAKRLLTFLSDGWYDDLSSDKWEAGVPGIDFHVVCTANDDGNMPAALRSRLEPFRFEAYAPAELAKIGFDYGCQACGQELDMDELFNLTDDPMVESPRDMIGRVKRMLSLEGVGQKSTAADVAASLGLDEDGLHSDQRRCLVAMADLKGKPSMDLLARTLGHRKSTVIGWIGGLMVAGFVSQGTEGGKYRLTKLGVKKAAQIKHS